MATYLAIDIGASSGRHIIGRIRDGVIEEKEIYRFTNGAKEVNGHLIWDRNSKTVMQLPNVMMTV